MLIECLIEREGPTHININGFDYSFKANEHGHSVCQVNSGEHRAWLFRSKNFRPYEPPVPEQQAEQEGHDAKCPTDDRGRAKDCSRSVPRDQSSHEKKR